MVQLLHEMLLFDARVESGIASAETALIAMHRRSPVVRDCGVIMTMEKYSVLFRF